MTECTTNENLNKRGGSNNNDDCGHSTSSASRLPEARVKVANPYLCLAGLYLGGFTGMYSETALNIALPQLSAAFSVDIALTQWLVVGYMLAIGIVLPFSSLLMKWFSARKITLFALGAFLIGSLISGFSSTFAVALIGRIIQGVGTGLVLPLMFSMVMEVIPPHKIGAAMGINALVIMSASAVGPTLAGFLIGALSWHWVFFSFAIVLAVGIVFTLKFMVNPYTLTRPRIDVLSVVTSCLGFGGIVLGVGMASLYGWGAAPTLVALIVGVVALIVYARRQLTMDDPVIDLRVFSVSGFRSGALCVMLNFGITLSAMYVLPQFYQNSLGLAVSFAGLIMLPGGIINAIVSMVSGNIYDKIGARIPALVGFALSVLGAGLLLLTTPESSLAYVVCCHIILMIGVPLAMSPCQTHALSSLPHKLSTDGSTMINTMQQVMGAVCTALATFLLATGQQAYYADGGDSATLAFAQGSHWGFMFALALAAIAFVLALGIKATKRSAATEPVPASNQAASAAPARVLDAAAGTLPVPRVADFMKTDVYTIAEDASALDAMRLFAEKKISGVPVVDGSGQVTGFVSDGDIIGTLARQNPTYTSFYAFTTDESGMSFEDKLTALQNLQVGNIATPHVLSVNLGDDMRDVCTLLAQHHLKKVPVMDRGKMVGILNRSDITRYTVGMYK